MAEKKFSQLTAKGATIADTDLVAISESAGGGSYVSKSVTGANIKALVTDANLTTTDITTNNVSTSKHGFVPKAPNNATQFLDGTGAFDTVKDSDLSTSDITTNNVSITKHGFAPKAPNDANQYLNGLGQWSTVSAGLSSIPQEDIIYVDSINGLDDLTANRGQIQKPYATVEYALANTTNTGTVTGNTTSGSATISSVSDTTNIKVGQYITGTNIPYNSIVVSKTANTIVLSKTATGTGSTITLTWRTIKTIKLVTSIVATSNWFKSGFWFDCGDNNITWGNFILFNRTAANLIPEFIIGGNWHGNNASSQFISTNTASSHDLFVEIISLYSIGTGSQVNIDRFTGVRNITFTCQSFDARFGSIGVLSGSGLTNLSGNFYGLLGGIELPGSAVVNGYIETPASVNAFVGRSGYYTINASILGSVTTSLDGQTKSFNLNGSVKGTTVSLANGGQYWLGSNINGDIECTTLTVTSNNYETLINGRVNGNVTLNGGILKIASFYSGTLTVSGASSKAYITSTVVYSDSKWYGNISLTSGGTLYWYGSADFGTPTAAYIFPTLSIASGCVVHIYGKLMAEITSLAGTLNVYSSGYLWSIKKTPAITGSLNNYGGIIELTRNGYLNTTESATTTPTIDISTGTYLQDGGTLFCTNADSKSGLIRKTASGGKVVLKGQPYLKVANGLAPLQILSNTGTAQDVLDFSMVGNGATGFRLADTFSDTTYGTAYAPNLLVNGTRYESTTYSF